MKEVVGRRHQGLEKIGQKRKQKTEFKGDRQGESHAPKVDLAIQHHIVD